MFIEALKQFVYRWIFKWIRENLEDAEDRYARKVLNKAKQQETEYDG